MRIRYALCALGLWIGVSGPVSAQLNLNPNPARALGHPQLTSPVSTTNPNLVEGREFNLPQVVAIDTTVSPPVLYVTDLGNNRILGWRDARAFSNGSRADFVIGQRDRFNTHPQGPASSYPPGRAISTGLYRPTGMVVDSSGNLYVLDAGNNRILRFPKPYATSEPLPDMLIGQVNFGCNTCGNPNAGGVTAKTLAISSGATVFASNLAIDPQGNLWVTDSGNHRVLRYPAATLAAATNNPAADLVLGQTDFTTSTGPSNESVLGRVGLVNPAGIAFDPSGRLYVTDSTSIGGSNLAFASVGRMAVFAANLTSFDSGRAALRVAGIFSPAPGQTQRAPEVNDVQFLGPQSVFMIGNIPAVVDYGHHRLVMFEPFDQWPADGTSPHARASTGPVGQFGYNAGLANRGNPEPGPNSFTLPTSAAVANNELYVVDSGNHRVLVFPNASAINQNSDATRVLGQDLFYLRAPNLTEGREFNFNPGSGGFDGSVIIDVNAGTPHLYVADTYNHRILGFRDARRVRPGDRADLVIGQSDYQRALINSPSNSIDTPNAQGLYLPIGLALDPQGNLYVCDLGNGRVLRFPKPFERGDYPAADLVVGQINFTTKIQDPTSRTMRAPYGLAFAGDNGLLVSDVQLNRVLFFRGAPNELSNGMQATKVFGQSDFTSLLSGSANNRMDSPRHVATDSDDRLYVADGGNNRVLIFDRATIQPDFNATPANILLGPAPNTRFNGVRGLFVSKNTGEIWTSEISATRLIRFPKFDDLGVRQNQAEFSINTLQTAAITLDTFGSLFAVDAANRVSVYFPDLRKVLNAANYITNRELTPGVIVYLESEQGRFGTTEAVNSAAVWPKTLADIQVLVNDAPAPMYYVFPEKIAFLMPIGAPTSGTVEVQVVRASTGQILAVSYPSMAPASPALFTSNSAGSGQIAALNEDGSINSPGNPIPRGRVIQLFGTGQGFIPGAPPDGESAPGALSTPDRPRVALNATFLPDSAVEYSGLAPGLVGLWQINVRIPDTIPPGNNIVMFVQMRSINSTEQGKVTTIAVRQ